MKRNTVAAALPPREAGRAPYAAWNELIDDELDLARSSPASTPDAPAPPPRPHSAADPPQVHHAALRVVFS